MIARLENNGPFAIFFTLSAGDMRFYENFTSHLGNKNIRHEFIDGEEQVFVEDIPLKEYLNTHLNEHEFIKKNVLTSTLNFSNRLKAFFNNIVMAKSSPLKVKYYGYKTGMLFIKLFYI
jgi:hypothetical protein